MAPRRMKMPRRIRAMMMPTIRTSCWYFRGTENLAMMMMKTNRLSMLRLYSVTQPATNWPPYSAPVKANMAPANTRASVT
jgi:hypothetical protein